MKPPNPKRPRSNELESGVDLSKFSPEARAYIERLEKKYSELKEKSSGLEKEVSELKEKSSGLEKENKKIHSQSLGQLLRDPPELKLRVDGTQKSHTGKSKHRDAQATEFEQALKLEKEKSDEGADLDTITSMVLTKFARSDQEDGSIGYSTETDISFLVS